MYLDKKFLKSDPTRQANFAPVEKRQPAVKFIDKKTQSRKHLEKELEERHRPNVFTYSPDDRKVKNRVPLFTFPKGHKGERTPSPDRKKALYVSHKQTKKNSVQIAILPEHNVTEKQLYKEFEDTRIGPSTYKT